MINDLLELTLESNQDGLERPFDMYKVKMGSGWTRAFRKTLQARKKVQIAKYAGKKIMIGYTVSV